MLFSIYILKNIINIFIYVSICNGCINMHYYIILQLEDKVQQLTDLTTKKSIVSLNLSKFKEYVKSPPRDYSFIIMFTAMAPSRRCTICQHVYDEYLIVANSFRFSPAYNNKLFFGIVDFDEGSDIFQMVSVHFFLNTY